MYMKDGKPAYVYNFLGLARYTVSSPQALPPGPATVTLDFVYDGGGIGKGGRGTLAVDGRKVAEGRFEKTIPFRFSLDESFDVGQDTGSPVIDEYDARMPFKFSGTIKKVEVKLGADQLSPQKRGELEQLKKDFALRMQ